MLLVGALLIKHVVYSYQRSIARPPTKLISFRFPRVINWKIFLCRICSYRIGFGVHPVGNAGRAGKNL